MRQFKLFTLLYSAVGIGFATYGFKSGNYLVVGIGLLAFIAAICSTTHWWKRYTLALGKGNVIFGWLLIAVIVGLQLYGLATKNYGFSPALIGFLTLTLVATLDAMYILTSKSMRRLKD